MITMTYFIEQHDDDLEVTVDFDYTAPCKGTRGEYGLQMEPDEPASIEIISIKTKDTTIDISTLDENMLDKIEQACFDYIELKIQEDAAERMAEDREERRMRYL